VLGARIVVCSDYVPAMSLFVHSDVNVDGRRYRVILRDGAPVGVAVWVIEEFGPRAPHAYWRRVWTVGRRPPSRMVRVAIAKAMAAAPESVGRRLAPQHDAPHRATATADALDAGHEFRSDGFGRRKKKPRVMPRWLNAGQSSGEEVPVPGLQ
jgi:hypothetical protein